MRIFSFKLVMAVGCSMLNACSAHSSQVYGDPAIAANDHNAFGRALMGLTASDWSTMRKGKSVFVRVWAPVAPSAGLKGGLGPLFNANACTACHFKDGRGGLSEGHYRVPAPLIYLVPKQTAPNTAARWGRQIQTHSTEGTPEAVVCSIDDTIEYTYPSGESVELRRPRHYIERAKATQSLARVPRAPTGTSSLARVPRTPTGISPLARAPPTLVGLGLLEAVAEETIAARADPDDRDGDGISGRMSRVAPGQQLGRFGWKAQQATLSSQVAAALSEDMGITTRQHPYAGCAPKDKACRGAVDASGRPEMTDQDFDRLIAYLRSVAPPAPRPETPSSRRGEALFVAAGCEACHRTTLVTPSVVDDAFPHGVAQQRIYPFTDLLLHDMGPGLADGESTGSTAAPGEWRTAPLWGLGLLKTVNGTMQLLHDGRARTFEEAILWHGGEAAGAQARYTRLSKAERNDLNAFLQRL